MIATGSALSKSSNPIVQEMSVFQIAHPRLEINRVQKLILEGKIRSKRMVKKIMLQF